MPRHDGGALLITAVAENAHVSEEFAARRLAHAGDEAVEHIASVLAVEIAMRVATGQDPDEAYEAAHRNVGAQLGLQLRHHISSLN